MIHYLSSLGREHVEATAEWTQRYESCWDPQPHKGSCWARRGGPIGTEPNPRCSPRRAATRSQQPAVWSSADRRAPCSRRRRTRGPRQTDQRHALTARRMATTLHRCGTLCTRAASRRGDRVHTTAGRHAGQDGTVGQVQDSGTAPWIAVDGKSNPALVQPEHLDLAATHRNHSRPACGIPWSFPERVSPPTIRARGPAWWCWPTRPAQRSWPAMTTGSTR